MLLKAASDGRDKCTEKKRATASESEKRKGLRLIQGYRKQACEEVIFNQKRIKRWPAELDDIL